MVRRSWPCRVFPHAMDHHEGRGRVIEMIGNAGAVELERLQLAVKGHFQADASVVPMVFGSGDLFEEATRAWCKELPYEFEIVVRVIVEDTTA